MEQASKAVVTMFFVLVLGVGVSVAQHDHAAMTDQSQSKPNSEDMMKACHKHGSEAMEALDKLEVTIAAGRESNDPVKMKEALDTALRLRARSSST